MLGGWSRLFLFSSLASYCAGLVGPYEPPALPLAVKSPYLNTWMQWGADRQEIQGNYPQFWNGNETAWIVAVRIDGSTYTVMGRNPFPQSTGLRAIDITPTSISFLNQATSVVYINTTFLSPVTPTDLVRQSLPFTYLTVNVTSTDGSSHDVQVYTEMTPEWLTEDWDLTARWNTSVQANAIVHQINLEGQAPLTDIDGFAQDGSLFYAMRPASSQTYQSGSSNDVRQQFSKTGVLNNTQDTDFRAVDANFPSLAIAADLGTISSTGSNPVVCTVGFINDPAIKYTTANNTVQLRSSLFWSNFSSALDAVSFVLDDYPNAASLAAEFDGKLLAAGASVSSDLADLVSFATRQVMSSVDITIARDASGNWDTNDIKVFQKDFGTGAVSQVDVLYSSFPAFLYLNPELAGYLLTPLLQYQEGSAWTAAFAAENLGTSYPNATGDPTQHNKGIEESANMIIMSLAHAQATNNSSLISAHYSLFSKWGAYLVEFSMRPGSQSGPFPIATEVNQTNLALKGILGLAAMGQISDLTGNTADSQKFTSTAKTFLQQWMRLSVGSDNNVIFATFEADTSSVLAYNIFIDHFLGLNFLPPQIYEAQAIGLAVLPSSNSFGVAIDDKNPTFTSSDTMMMTAAALKSYSASSSTTLIGQVHQYFTGDSISHSPSSAYNTMTGQNVTGTNSPAVGAVFAMLIPSILNATPGSGADFTTIRKKSIAGPVAGGVIAAIVVLAIITIALIFRRRGARGQTTPLLPTFAPSWKRRIPRVSPGGKGSNLLDPRSSVSSQTPLRAAQTVGEPEMSARADLRLAAPMTLRSSKDPSVSTAVSSSALSPQHSNGSPLREDPSPTSPRRGNETVLRGEIDQLRQEMQRQMEEIRRSQEPPAYLDLESP